METTNIKPSKYYLYARKSSEAEERQVMSIEAQLFELEQFAKREGIKITERFVESKSAKTPGRTEFNKMLEKLYASKEPVGIIAWHPDRLARNSVDGGQIVYLIDIQKVGALKFPTFWFEPTPQGMFMLQVAFGQSKYYSDNLSENVKRGIRQKLRRGEWIGKAPIGYLNNPKTRNIDLDPVKSKIIKKMFEEFAKGNESVESITHRLEFFGIVNQKGEVHYKSMVYFMLTNPIYTGVIKTKGELHEGTFEPLISNELFEAVQKRLKQNSRPRKSKHKHDFAFTELLKCGECGCGITAQYGKGNGGTYRYYRCTKKKQKCSQGYLREDLLAEQIKTQLQEISLPDSWSPVVFAQMATWEDEERKNLQVYAQKVEITLAEIQMKLDKLVGGFLDGIIDRAIYLQKKEEYIKAKIDWEQKQKEIGKRGCFWLEPMQEWLETAVHAGKLAVTNDFSQIKSFVEKNGSNRLLKEKKVGVEWSNPFGILLKYKALGALEESKNKKGLVRINPTSPIAYPESGSNRQDREVIGV